MSTRYVATELVDRCRQGKNLEAIDRLYADSIVSIEPVGSTEMPSTMRGKTAVKAKNECTAEIAVYTVANDRIVQEQFFYHMPGA